MTELKQKADQFKRLHVPGKPLVLCNVWDSGSAKAVAAAGAKAIATSSWAVAAAAGYEDGEHMSRDFLMANLQKIAASTSLPVSVDIESGYGLTPQEVCRTVELTIAAGAIGCNIEDSSPLDGAMRSIPEQTARIAEARKAVEAAGIGYFINARCDVFFKIPEGKHDKALLKAARERASAYADAGASGLFVPGLKSEGLIAELAETAVLPINIMSNDMAVDLGKLSKMNVARVSFGPVPYLAAMNTLGDIARGLLSRGP